MLSRGQDEKSLTRFVNKASALRAEEEGHTAWEFDRRLIAAMVSQPNRFYSSFTIPKKSGGERRIDAPHKPLKMVQRALSFVFDSMFSPAESAYGFIHGRGIVQNAQVHLGQDYVLNVDLKGFFPSISTGRLIALFRSNPATDMSVYMATSIARLCSFRGALPQGSPASPVLTNMVSVRLDARLAGLSQRYGCTYSRYVDDLTFSAERRRPLDKMMPRLEQILVTEGFELNPDKTRMQFRSMRQEVTGLVISHSDSGVEPMVNAPRKFRRDVRAALHVWRRDGLQLAAERNVATGDPDVFIHQIRGKVAHMCHVNRTPEANRIHTEFNTLLKRDRP